MENITKELEFRMARFLETRSRSRRSRGRDRSHNSLLFSLFHFAVCLSSLNSCCGLCLSFFFSLCFPFLRCPGLQAPLVIFLSFSNFVRCALPVGVFIFFFYAFPVVLGHPGWGHGSVLFQLRAGFSAKAGTFDFERQYSVLGVFPRFRGLEKHRKSKNKLLGNVLFVGAAEKEVRDRFFKMSGLPCLFNFRIPGWKKGAG